MNTDNQKQTPPLLSVESSDLLTCPFCGEKPKYSRRVESETHPGNYWPEMVQCPSCKIAFRTDENGVNSSTEKWNTRQAKAFAKTSTTQHNQMSICKTRGHIVNDVTQRCMICDQSVTALLKNTERTQGGCNETADDYQETDKAMEVEDFMSDDFKQALKIMAQSLAGKGLYETFCKSQLNPTPWSQLNTFEQNRWAALVDPDLAIKSAKIHVSNREHSHDQNKPSDAPTCSEPFFNIEDLEKMRLSQKESDKFKLESRRFLSFDEITGAEVTFHVKKNGEMMIGGIGFPNPKGLQRL